MTPEPDVGRDFPGRERLAAIDARLGHARTLDPDRPRATPLATLVATVTTDPTRDARVVEAFAHGVADVADAILENFPDNIFWDLDGVLSTLWGGPCADERGDASVREVTRAMVELQEMFGRHGPIRFRYAHDFLLGYDWARWVRRDPASRAGIGPFDRAFLDRMRRRGGELLALIDDDDRKYPRLDGPEHRNPFGFSREPGDEARLLEDLAARALVPVRVWSREATPRWDQPFAELREARARALGMAAGARR